MAEVRAATPADVADAVELMVEAYQTRFPWLGEPEAACRARFSKRFAERHPHLRVIGAIGALEGLSEQIGSHINLLFVRSPGSGVGLRLLRAAEVRGAWSLDCFAANHRAQAFYRRAGWTSTATFWRPLLGQVHQQVEFRRL
jgi:putative acetyltransferase